MAEISPTDSNYFYLFKRLTNDNIFKEVEKLNILIFWKSKMLYWDSMDPYGTTEKFDGEDLYDLSHSHNLW